MRQREIRRVQKQDTPIPKVPYIAKDRTSNKYLKHGSSSNPRRRVADKFFGKAPRGIKCSIKNKSNRVIDTIFVPPRNSPYTGDFLERLFHKQYESLHVVGEWLKTTDRSVIVAFYQKYGWKAKRVKISCA